jgi:hypothetical protein
VVLISLIARYKIPSWPLRKGTVNVTMMTVYPILGTDSNPVPRKCKERMLPTQTQIPIYLIMFLKINIFCYCVQLRNGPSLQSKKNPYLSNQPWSPTWLRNFTKQNSMQSVKHYFTHFQILYRSHEKMLVFSTVASWFRNYKPETRRPWKRLSIKWSTAAQLFVL